MAALDEIVEVFALLLFDDTDDAFLFNAPNEGTIGAILFDDMIDFFFLLFFI